MAEFIGREVIICPQAQSSQQHIGNADFQCVPVEYLQIEVVQFFQQTVLAAVQQVLQVVRDVVRHGVMAGRAHCLCEIFFLSKAAKGGLQRFNDSRFKGSLHCPDRQWTRKSGFVRVRYIEVEFQQVLPIVTEHGNAFRTAIDPAAKLPVPAFHFQNSGCVRALGIDQDLFIKRAFVVIAGRTEKACPAFIAAGDAPHGLVVQFGDELKFGRQGNTSYRSGSARFLARERALFFSCAR